MKLQEKISKLRSQAEQVSAPKGQASKYIVILWNGQEQIITFPGHIQHAAILECTRQEAPHIQLVSAGFYLTQGNKLWAGGESVSLEVASRPQDAELLRQFLSSPDRHLWDLTTLTVNGGAQ